MFLRVSNVSILLDITCHNVKTAVKCCSYDALRMLKQQMLQVDTVTCIAQLTIYMHHVML